MKVNPNYLGRLFTEQELSLEERQLAKQLLSMRKGERTTRSVSVVVAGLRKNGICLLEDFIAESV